jgi:hypothetical protein
MPSFGYPDNPEFNDYHNLYPINQSNVSERRCNYPLGDVVVPMNPPQVYLGCELGYDANNNLVFEPRDEHKGRAARALMYMAVCYSDETGLFSFDNSLDKACVSNPINYSQNQNVIKEWHFQYPPDAFDMARNDFLDSLQGNRNPFVDQPEYACYIDFYTLSHISNPPALCYDLPVGLNKELNGTFSILPNPANNAANLTFFNQTSTSCTLEIFNVNGQRIQTSSFGAMQGLNQQSINTSDLAAGTYVVRLVSGSTVRQQLLMVSK